jgi:subtilisin family serine protease
MIDGVTGKETVLGTQAMAADHVIVKLWPSTNQPEMRAAALARNGNVIRKLRSPNTFLIEVEANDAGDLDTAIARLKRNREVEYAEPDYVVFATTVPNDPLYSYQWGLENLQDTDIDAETAWTTSTGSSDIVVGVIDTGIDYNHPDLAANIWINSGEDHAPLGVVGPEDFDSVDDDGNGLVDDVRGWDFANDDDDPMDDFFHGTHVAGIIGAVTNNGVGVAGVAWQVKLMALKFLDENGYGYTSDAVEAIRYATSKGVFLTSNSWGGWGTSFSELQALEEANAAGILFVCAAGNEAGEINGMYPVSPPIYNTANMITVAAVNQNDELADFSNYGLDAVHLGAPGVDIWSTTPTTITPAMTEYGLASDYGSLSGTSMATPYVSGVCVLLKSQSPNLIASDVKPAVLASTYPVPALQGMTVTGGRLNAAGALTTIGEARPYVRTVAVDDDNQNGTSGNDNAFVEPGETVGLRITLRNGGLTGLSGVTATLSLPQADPYISIITGTVSYGTLGGASEVLPTGEFIFSVDPNTSTPHAASFTLTITDQNQNTWTETLTRSIALTGNVSGVVTLDGQPQPGATVWYLGPTPDLPDAEEWRFVTTDATGSYSLDLVEPGATLQVRKDGCIPTDAVFIAVPPNSQDVDFAFHAFAVSGNVTSTETGLPIGGASVHIFSTIDTIHYDYSWDGLNTSLTADGSGYYTYAGITGRVFPLGVYATKSAAYLASPATRATITSGNYSADLALPRNTYAAELIPTNAWVNRATHVNALNRSGWVMGYDSDQIFIRTANGQMHVLGSGFTPSTMNESGHIAGAAVVNNTLHLMLFTDTNANFVIDSGEVQDLGPELLTPTHYGVHMNNNDEIVNGSKLYLPSAAYGLPAGVNDLWSSQLWQNEQVFAAINDNGRIVGMYYHPILSSFMGYIWNAGTYFDLHNFGLPAFDPYNSPAYLFQWQYANDINNNGVCTGSVSTSAGDIMGYAFQDINDNQQVDVNEVTALAPLPNGIAGYGTGSSGNRINESGNGLIGWVHEFDADGNDTSQDAAWLEGGLVPADALIHPSWGWQALAFWDINNTDQILAFGTNAQNQLVDLLLTRYRPCSPELLSAASRRSHGTAGDLDVSLPLSGTIGVESRMGGVQHIILTFNEAVNAADYVLDDELHLSIGQIDSIQLTGATIDLAVSGIPDQSCATLRIERLRTLGCSTMLQPIFIHFKALAHDVNADGVVTAADHTMITAHAGETASATNAWLDTNVSGAIDNTDAASAQQAIGAQIVCTPVVVNRLVFYNNSAYDGNDPLANAADDHAIATDKVALMPGLAALKPTRGPRPANYITCSKGITGVMVDILDLPGTPTAADFEFTNTGRDFTGNTAAASPTSITVREGAGAGGSDRITIVWADNAIPNTIWLKTTVKATLQTGLSAADVFYFGIAIGDTLNPTTGAVVNALDVSGTNAYRHTSIDPALVTDEYDFNRDSLVDTTDISIITSHYTNGGNCLLLTTAP